VGCKGFTEQLIIGEMMAQLLDDRLEDVNVELVDGLSTSALRDGIEAGDLDIIAEYTGTAWLVHFGQEYEAGTDNNALYQSVKEADEANNINWLDPIWNNNTYAFASWSDFVETHNVTTLSDLAALYEDMEGMIDTSITIEWDTRPDGKAAFEQHYGFTYDPGSRLVVEAGLTLGALQEEQVDVGMVFATDSWMAELGWHVYQDDLSFFPPYDMTPSVRAEVLAEYPEIETILNELVATFPGGGQSATPATVGECQAVWQELNNKVDNGGMFPDEVAAEYLADQGLV
jgi:osmoprotectant transport system substrate-binding protein